MTDKVDEILTDRQIEILKGHNVETLELIKEEAEITYQELITGQKTALDKTTTLTRFVIPIIILLSVYISKEIYADKFNVLISASIILLSGYTISLIILLSVIFPKKSKTIGTEPKKILDEKFKSKEDILRNKIYNIQKIITTNYGSINILTRKLRISFSMLIITSLSTVIFLLTVYFVHLYQIHH